MQHLQHTAHTGSLTTLQELTRESTAFGQRLPGCRKSDRLSTRIKECRHIAKACYLQHLCHVVGTARTPHSCHSCHTVATQLPHISHTLATGTFYIKLYRPTSRDMCAWGAIIALLRHACLYGKFQWLMCGNCVATVWQLCGYCVATARCVCGDAYHDGFLYPS